MKKIFFYKPYGSESLSLLSLFLRLAIGGAMLTHGIAKIGSFSALSAAFPDPVGFGSLYALIMAIGAEVGCSLLLIVGLATRLALLPLIFAMSMAVFVVHGFLPFGASELAVLYLIVYITIFILGAGRYSIDRLILK